MTLRIVGHQVECVRNFALVFEDVDSTRGHHAMGELRFVPTDVERRDYMVEKIGGDAARVLPVFPETEETVGVIRALRSGAQPAFPIDVVVALAFRAGILLDGVVPLALDGIAMIRA